SLALLLAAPDDHVVGPLVLARLEALGKLAPWRAGMTAAARATLATAHRVIDRVHRHAAVVRTTAQPALTPRLTEADVAVVVVRDLGDGGPAVEVKAANLAARPAHLPVVAVLGHQLRGGAGGADHLAALALAHLDVVNRGARRDVTQAQAIAGLDVGLLARQHLGAHLEPVGREDVALLAIGVVEQRDASRAIRIVFDGRHPCRNADLVAPEIDDPIALLVAAATEASR